MRALLDSNQWPSASGRGVLQTAQEVLQASSSTSVISRRPAFAVAWSLAGSSPDNGRRTGAEDDPELRLCERCASLNPSAAMNSATVKPIRDRANAEYLLQDAPRNRAKPRYTP